MLILILVITSFSFMALIAIIMLRNYRANCYTKIIKGWVILNYQDANSSTRPCVTVNKSDLNGDKMNITNNFFVNSILRWKTKKGEVYVKKYYKFKQIHYVFIIIKVYKHKHLNYIELIFLSSSSS